MARASAGSIVGNAAAMVAAQIVTKVINIAVSILMVRWLGAYALGAYSYIIAFSYPFGIVADFGLGTLGIRELSRDPSREGMVVATLRRALLLLAGPSVVLMLAVAVLAGHEGRTVAGIALAGGTTLLSALTTPHLVALTAREELRRMSLYRIIASSISSVATLGVLLAGGSVLALLAAATVTQVLMLGFARWLARARDTAAPGVPPAVVRVMLRQAVPFGLLMLAFALYYRLDMIMLEWLRGSREVGIYAAAYRFLDAVMLLAAALAGPFYPRLSSLVATDPGEARRLLEDAWRPLLALGLPASLGIVLLADELTLVLWGAEFHEAASIIRVVILGTLPLLWVNVANHALIAANRVWALASVYATVALVGVGGNLALVPGFGAFGAGLTTLACEWLMLLLVVRLVRQRFGLRLVSAGLWRYALAAASMAGAIWLVSRFGLAAEIPLGALAYVACLMLLGYTRSVDALAVKRLLAR